MRNKETNHRGAPRPRGARPEAALALSWLAVDGRDAREDSKTKELKTPPLRREQELYVRAVDDAILGKCDEARRRAVCQIRW